jgi:hypothetical protein
MKNSTLRRYKNHLQGLYEAVNHQLGNGSLSLRELAAHSPLNFIVNHYSSAGFSPDDQSSLIHYEHLLSYAIVPVWLAQQLEARFDEGFTFTDEGHLPLKQDLPISACDKVSNPDEMTTWLEHYKVAYLIDSSKPSNYNDLLRLVDQAG